MTVQVCGCLLLQLPAEYRQAPRLARASPTLRHSSSICFFRISSLEWPIALAKYISYNSPIYPTPLPCTFPASRSSILINHLLPPKPPISIHFRTYTLPTRKPETTLYNMAVQHVDHGKPIPLNDDQKRPFVHHHATASSIGELSSSHIDSVIYPSCKNTITRLKNGHNVDSVNSDDLSHPDKLFSWIQNNSNAGSCEASVAFPSIPSDRSEGDLSSILRPIASCQPSEELETFSSGCSSSQPVTETTACSSSKISQSKARTRVEASDLSSLYHRAQAYSDIEDELLRKLVHKGLSWELIEEEFSWNFTGRDWKSLQGCWRNLKFTVQPTRHSRCRGN
ncbi:hypothetical protein BDW68DRAFT_188303 [Aspergillus falconensis]